MKRLRLVILLTMFSLALAETETENAAYEEDYSVYDVLEVEQRAGKNKSLYWTFYGNWQ